MDNRRKLSGLYRRLIADDRGAEMVEWVVITTLVVLSGIAVYNLILTDQLQTAVSRTGERIENVAEGNAGS